MAICQHFSTTCHLNVFVMLPGKNTGDAGGRGTVGETEVDARETRSGTANADAE